MTVAGPRIWVARLWNGSSILSGALLMFATGFVATGIAQERPKPTPRRLSRPLEDAPGALRRGHGGASSNPVPFKKMLQ
jgi:hypothetical protein